MVKRGCALIPEVFTIAGANFPPFSPTDAGVVASTNFAVATDVPVLSAETFFETFFVSLIATSDSSEVLFFVLFLFVEKIAMVFDINMKNYFLSAFLAFLAFLPSSAASETFGSAMTMYL